jgi:hypothetical protein
VLGRLPGIGRRASTTNFTSYSNRGFVLGSKQTTAGIDYVFGYNYWAGGGTLPTSGVDLNSYDADGTLAPAHETAVGGDHCRAYDDLDRVSQKSYSGEINYSTPAVNYTWGHRLRLEGVTRAVNPERIGRAVSAFARNAVQISQRHFMRQLFHLFH